MNGGHKNIVLGALFLLVCILVLSSLTDYTRNFNTINYSTFLEKVQKDEVKEVQVYGQEVTGIYKNGGRFETVVAQDPHDWEVLKDHGVQITVANSSSQFNFWYIALLFGFISAIALAVWWIFRQSRSANNSGGGNIFTMGQSKARMFMPSTIKENFDSVAGAVGAKEELKDIIDYLKNPDKYRRLGAKVTRGVLLIGDPGNGKTLLAKAVAGEAHCPFFSISGSDFIEVFVGVGAARVRDLFKQARKHAPCIIFIDEIDAVGRQRGSGMGGGHDEREQTLNQLLAEMDGFSTVEGAVIVIAATNRPDVLDKALLRPGRFDRKVVVPYPDLVCRERILELHAKNIKLDPEVDLKRIARKTMGFSGAQLANIINEAAITASNRNHETVRAIDFEEAMDKITMGKVNSTLLVSEQEKLMTAYHEAGHTLVNLLQPEITEPLHKVTILSRGGTLGATHFMPERDKNIETAQEYMAFMRVGLGGRIAEELIFGKKTTGAGNDFVKVTEIAYNLVCRIGVSSELGPVIYAQDEYGRTSYSQQTAYMIDQEVRRLVEQCYQEAKQMIVDNKDKLDLLAHALLEKEELMAEEVYALIGIEPRPEVKA